MGKISKKLKTPNFFFLHYYDFCGNNPYYNNFDYDIKLNKIKSKLQNKQTGLLKSRPASPEINTQGFH